MMKVRMPYFCRHEDMWRDGWTYGEWTQYVCKRGEESQCVKVSGIPFAVAFFAFVFFVFMIFTMLTFPPIVIAWHRAIIFTCLMGVIAIAPWVWRAFGWEFVQPVGPINKDGKRVLNGEEV